MLAVHTCVASADGNVDHSNDHSHVQIQFGVGSPLVHRPLHVSSRPHCVDFHVVSQVFSPFSGVPRVLGGLKKQVEESYLPQADSESTVVEGIQAREKERSQDGVNLNIPALEEEEAPVADMRTSDQEARQGRQFTSPDDLVEEPLADEAGRQVFPGQVERQGRQFTRERDSCSELVCPGVSGPVASAQECPAGQQEVCLEVLETECATASTTECRDYEETECEVVPRETCITADVTTCTDTQFQVPCINSAEECRTVETQKCGQPVEEQVCAEINQVECNPGELTTCNTTVSVEVVEECVEVQEVTCKDHYDQICYIGFAPGECESQEVQECKYVTQACSGYHCAPKKEKVCNIVSKTNCHYASPTQRCKGLPTQKCETKPVTQCVSVPKVVAEESCETKAVNNCKEVPTKECLSTFKTLCDAPEEQSVCFDLSSASECGAPITNRVCEGQQQEVCFTTNETVCTKIPKQICYDIPTVSCEKVPSKKCFMVPTPPQLEVVRIPGCVTPSELEQGILSGALVRTPTLLRTPFFGK